MPALQNYDVLLDFTNDMHDPVSIQLLRDYGRQSGQIMLLNPAETLTLILESGCSYQYAVKSHTKVANVTAQSWRDISCCVSQLLSGSTTDAISSHVSRAVNGLSVDRLWRDYRYNVWNEV